MLFSIEIIYFEEVIIKVIKVISKEEIEIITPVFGPTAAALILLLLGSTYTTSFCAK
jgi:hypothetical protein